MSNNIKIILLPKYYIFTVRQYLYYIHLRMVSDSIYCELLSRVLYYSCKIINNIIDCELCNYIDLFLQNIFGKIIIHS